MVMIVLQISLYPLMAPWQRRCFVYLNGTGAAISMDNGNIIDVEIMQKYCKPCQQHKEKLNQDDFDIWYEGHKQNCVANYEGSARKVRYLKYYGDRDIKAYLEVKDTYKPDMVNKYECIGHYLKEIRYKVKKAEEDNKRPRSIGRCSYRETAELFWYGLTYKYWQHCRKWLMQFGQFSACC